MHMDNDILVSVVVPVYNVEQFIGHCVDSLFGQSMLDNVEFIFVDDATPDNSLIVIENYLENYPERSSQVIILHHSSNKGLPAARNTGLEVARGEYVYHCDSDDFLELNALKAMYDAAKQRDADIVWCDWFLSLEKSERYMKQPDYPTSMEALKGMLCGTMKYNVWNKLVRRKLYTENSIQFPAGHGMGEDMTMIRLFAFAKKVCYLPQAFYHYVRLNVYAFTQLGMQVNEQHLEDLKYNVYSTIGFIEKMYGKQLERELAFFKLEVKFPFLITNAKSSYKRWSEWFPEANSFILQNKSISCRSRLLQYMASKRQFWYVRLYYFLLIKLVYGIIYK